jgi:hypothetical protein
MKKNVYGNIEDIVINVKMVTSVVIYYLLYEYRVHII